VPATLTTRKFLDTVYTQLEFERGVLLPAQERPKKKAKDWLEKGDWQTLAAQVGAEKIFFVGQNPVIVFARLENHGEQTFRELYRRIWSMARPQFLFLARPGELAVYDLTQPPPKSDQPVNDGGRLIDRVEVLAEVQTTLAAFHREKIETGDIFGESRFGDKLNRADRALIRDLKLVRHELNAVGSATLADLHSLLGRCIFVRYLEDREIINRDYFEKVITIHPNKSHKWQKILDSQVGTFVDSAMEDVLFLRILQDREFTYALFEQLANDFNGDTFPIENSERAHIKQAHLDRLRGFLCGEPAGQRELFFYAYKFDVIPIELISSIYEEFYNERVGKEQNQGSHYTPPTLVEFLLSQTLTHEVLDKTPRIIDPACGSGIFLVESFRRVVRHRWAKDGGKVPDRQTLQKILRDQIAGIDINPEAVRVTAFSLYLAFLHYQQPRKINEQRRLPHLKWVDQAERDRRNARKPNAQFFDVLLQDNAFNVVDGKLPDEVVKRFGSVTADVVVGNPPWGYPKRTDHDGTVALEVTLAWCRKQNKPVGDKELSQAFIHLSLELLKKGGRAGLLISTGVFFKNHQQSKEFRQAWLNAVKLTSVVNFAHVRHAFFSGENRSANGIAPFAAVVFDRQSCERNRFAYWSAKRTLTIEKSQCVILNRGDMHYLNQEDCLRNERLWKTFWWGRRQDEMLVSLINHFPNLKSLPHLAAVGYGFEEASGGKAADWLAKYKELPVGKFERYGVLNSSCLKTVPHQVYRRGCKDIYSGHRLLVRRGVPAGGQIVARFESQPFAFRHSIQGIRFKGLQPWQELSLLGIFWSSLARYYFWLTSGSWGAWHDAIHVDDIFSLPVSLPENETAAAPIVSIVKQLRNLSSADVGLFDAPGWQSLRELEAELDEAVYELYGLMENERDLVREMCSLGLDLFYKNQGSDAVKPVGVPSISFGTQQDLVSEDGHLADYLRTLLECWNPQIKSNGDEFAWQVITPSSKASLLAVLLETRNIGEAKEFFPVQEGKAWATVLEKLSQYSRLSVGSPFVLADTFYRLVSDYEILIVKRNERRFWTKSTAREDAEATMLQGMLLQERGGR
jgi:type I restriction-modification system DNA methylase subunit